jgi:hypothetical protein
MLEERKLFNLRTEAWDFMRECDKKGWKAGYPHCFESGGLWAVRYIRTEDK